MIEPNEVSAELIDEAKDLTWTTGVEVALVELGSGGRAFVSGGRDGIVFEIRDVSDRVILLCEVPEGDPLEIARIAWHTHPLPTGPSDGDRQALQVLGQDSSRVLEFGGEAGGTLFGPNKERPDVE